MQAVIHIGVGDQPVSQYNQPIIQWARESFPDLVTFDLDNFSEPAIISYASDLINHVDKLAVIIEAQKQANAGPLITFMEKLISNKNKKKIFLVLNGENALLEKMGKVLGPDQFFCDKDKSGQKKLLKKYFF